MKSLYVFGGAGSGKSTFVQNLLEEAGLAVGKLHELYALPNKKNVVTLRGHELQGRGAPGLYLGIMRDKFPGTDGLDRASSPVGEAWLDSEDWRPPFLISEGSTLATRRFLTALHRKSDLLALHLWADPEVVQDRFQLRGSEQEPSWVAATVTRSANLAQFCTGQGLKVLNVDSGDDFGLEIIFEKGLRHLGLAR